MVTKYREYGSEVEHCSTVHVSFRFTKHSQNVYKTEVTSHGAHCRFVLATFYCTWYYNTPFCTANRHVVIWNRHCALHRQLYFNYDIPHTFRHVSSKSSVHFRTIALELDKGIGFRQRTRNCDILLLTTASRNEFRRSWIWFRLWKNYIYLKKMRSQGLKGLCRHPLP